MIRLPLALHYYQTKQLKGLDLAEAFYLAVGKPMLEKAFPDYYPQMSIGLLGMGSECYGYDDYLSQDHDFYPRFVIIVDNDMSQEEQNRIHSAYQQLPDYFLGYYKQSGLYNQKRDGVFTVDSFFKQLLGSAYLLKQTLDWFYIDEAQLSLVQNGKLFKADNLAFTLQRQRLHCFPDDVRIKKIMSSIAKVAQAGQYNYGRMMKRGDKLTANHYLQLFIKETIHLLFLFNYQYCPYIKWQVKMAWENPANHEILKLLDQLLEVDDKEKIIEEICCLLLERLHEQHLSTKADSFLQNHLEIIRERINDIDIKKMHVMEG